MPEKYTKREWHCKSVGCNEQCVPKHECAVVQASALVPSSLPGQGYPGGRPNNIQPNAIIPFYQMNSWVSPTSSITLKDNVFQFEQVGVYLVCYEVYIFDNFTIKEAALYTFPSQNCSQYAPCGGCPVEPSPTTNANGNIVLSSKRSSEPDGAIIQCNGVLVNIQQPCTRMALCNVSSSLRVLILDSTRQDFNTFINISKIASC